MIEIRLAKENDIAPQKELWKLCFGDEDKYIDFYFAHEYKEENTVLLLVDGKIVSMLTMIPTKMMTHASQSINASMLYAIATHPKYRNRGYAANLIKYTEQYLKKGMSVLVPAEKHLFEFYRHQDYQEFFYVREVLFSSDIVDSFPIGKTIRCAISSASPQAYNQRRNQQLKGKFYLAYGEQEILYQKKLSQQSGADIYVIDIEEVQGCAVLERINAEKMFIKELLLPEEFLMAAIKEINQQISAKEYVLRTPVWLNAIPGGSIRPFGMFKAKEKIGLNISAQEVGYLGLAFD